jgi:uncharacterized protein YukE
MNSYSWVQAPSSSSLVLQREGQNVLQLTKDGGMVANYALFNALMEDTKFEGSVLVVDPTGMVKRSPISLTKISKEINDYFAEINTEINKMLKEVQKEDEKAMNKVVSDLNIALTTIQNNNKHEISQSFKSTDTRVQRIESLERMLWIMFVLIILLLVAVIRLFLKK